MNTYILLFRGINVGGKNTIKMKELVSLLEDLGLFQVQTYIQSGNVVYLLDITMQSDGDIEIELTLDDVDSSGDVEDGMVVVKRRGFP